MNEPFVPFDYNKMGREYLARADVIGEKIAQLKREYKRTRNYSLKVQMDNWKEIEADLRHQGLEFLRRGERRNTQSG